MEKKASIFGKFYSPYMTDDVTSMNYWYEEYKTDPNKTITFGGDGLQQGHLSLRILWY